MPFLLLLNVTTSVDNLIKLQTYSAIDQLLQQMYWHVLELY
jgi:hypothetical protein